MAQSGIGPISPWAAIKAIVVDWTPAPRLRARSLGSLIMSLSFRPSPRQAGCQRLHRRIRPYDSGLRRLTECRPPFDELREPITVILLADLGVVEWLSAAPALPDCLKIFAKSH